MVTAVHDQKRDTRETVHFYTACSEFELGLELQDQFPTKVSLIFEEPLGMMLDCQYPSPVSCHFSHTGSRQSVKLLTLATCLASSEVNAVGPSTCFVVNSLARVTRRRSPGVRRWPPAVAFASEGPKPDVNVDLVCLEILCITGGSSFYILLA